MSVALLCVLAIAHVSAFEVGFVPEPIADSNSRCYYTSASDGERMALDCPTGFRMYTDATTCGFPEGCSLPESCEGTTGQAYCTFKASETQCSSLEYHWMCLPTGHFQFLRSPLPSLFQELDAVASESMKDVHSDFEGHSGASARQTDIMYRLAANPEVATICETGFNSGHSSANFLTANPTATVHSFDLGNHPYAHATSRYLKEMFGDRFHIYFGDSTQTLATMKGKLACDLVFIDGGHMDPVPELDLSLMADLSHCDTILIVDDVDEPAAGVSTATFSDVVRTWVSARDNGTIRQTLCATTITGGFCVGRYVLPCRRADMLKAIEHDEL